MLGPGSQWLVLIRFSTSVCKSATYCSRDVMTCSGSLLRGLANSFSTLLADGSLSVFVRKLLIASVLKPALV